MLFHIETEQEEDGRWLAEVVELPGAMTYGATAREALRNVPALALQILADKLQHGELEPAESISFEQVQVALCRWAGHQGATCIKAQQQD